MNRFSQSLRRVVPGRLRHFVRYLRTSDDREALIYFFQTVGKCVSTSDKVRLLDRLCNIEDCVPCAHKPGELLRFIADVLTLPSSVTGAIIEAGCFMGGATTKISTIAEITHRRFFVFDSFCGVPPNEERSIKVQFFGRDLETDQRNRRLDKTRWPKGLLHNSDGSITFSEGIYSASLPIVRSNVDRYGAPHLVNYRPGFFEDTLPGFPEKIAAIYLDVDLASSTRVCLKYLYPLLEEGGVLYSHDGDLSEVIKVYEDSFFWRNEIGCAPPKIEGLRSRKVLKLRKPSTKSK